MAFAFVLVVAGRRRIGTVSILVAAGVAWSRVYQDAHHFSDVIVGTILGASIAFWTWHHLMTRLPSMDEWSARTLRKNLLGALGARHLWLRLRRAKTLWESPVF